MSGAEAAAGACPAHAQVLLANAAALSTAATNRLRIIYSSLRMFIVGWASAPAPLATGPTVGRGLRAWGGGRLPRSGREVRRLVGGGGRGGQRLAERQPHRRYLLLLGDDDFLRD